MTAFIELTVDGERHLINVNCIESICSGAVATIFPISGNGECWRVLDSYDEVKRKIYKALNPEPLLNFVCD